MIKSPFKTPKPKEFEYKPRFYDERKEDLKTRMKLIKTEVRMEKDEQSDLRTRIHKRWDRDYKQQRNRQSNLRIFFIAALLTIVAYYLLK
ncbi:MAG: hypothetical protein COA57_09155 [Flavobacteriales bacterium]|nr:hypothetical protein [Bacteroidales bacterium AH-315-I05]PCJ84455.1 MAG: hypothetical protein COA57_09155 [Flavobacteriales bacterium]